MSKAGFASPAVVIAALLVGVLMGVLGTNLFQSHHPNSPSPLAYSAPQALSSIHDSLAVEAYVDSDGRVQNYRVLSAGKTLPPQTKEHGSFLQPFVRATFMGKPTNGTGPEAIIIGQYGASASRTRRSKA